MTHPLEPLSAAEVARAVSLLAAVGKLTPTTRVVSVILKEPLKSSVHAGTGWNAIPRESAVVLFDNATNSCYEAELNLTAERVTAFKHVPGVQPTMTIDEQVECEQAVLNSPEFAAALKRVNKELGRMAKLAARTAHMEAARRALALRRAAQFVPYPPAGETADEGMRPIPSRRRRTSVDRAKIGRALSFSPSE